MFEDRGSAKWRRVMAFATIATLGLFATSVAHAVPSMARQTGYACSKCHTVFPELTRYGRQFKLAAYSSTSDQWQSLPFPQRLPVAGLVQVSRTQTQKTDTSGATPDDFSRDKETIVESAGGYYGGRIFGSSGALIQYSYDGYEQKWGMEMLDARYGRELEVGETELDWGVTLNNSPTLSDIYNSTPAWGFPHTESGTIMPAASTLIDMTLSSQVGGVTAYALWDDLVYGEVGAYRTAKSGPFLLVSAGDVVETVVDGTAPYWRIALQHEKGPHSVELGTYGMVARVLVDGEVKALGSDGFRDIALDASYQYVMNAHAVSVQSSWIDEHQDWKSSYSQGLSSLPTANLRTFRANVHYFYQRQWGGGIQYFQTIGDANAMRYDTGEAVMGSASGSPNSKGWVNEVDYLPWEFVKLAVRYTAYQKFNGASGNYDGYGRGASDNNSLFVLAWVLF